ncbi:hypothetical protein BDV59DRAFT_184780 [Aspergillus ambiguus]|uniref:uncharacterized protein n=1 Tax=Aspergillus ambiguus TaxID=176160 RepID=UPI003CCE0614
MYAERTGRGGYGNPVREDFFITTSFLVFFVRPRSNHEETPAFSRCKRSRTNPLAERAPVTLLPEPPFLPFMYTRTNRSTEFACCMGIRIAGLASWGGVLVVPIGAHPPRSIHDDNQVNCPQPPAVCLSACLVDGAGRFSPLLALGSVIASARQMDTIGTVPFQIRFRMAVCRWWLQSSGVIVHGCHYDHQAK